MNATLFDDFPILVDRVLAQNIGLNEAIVIQQLHYWIMQNKRQNKNFYDGRYWTFNSFENWHKDTFYFWGLSTIKRTFKKLENEGLLIIGNYNKKGYDRTKWYSINYDELSYKCCNNSLYQVEPMDSVNVNQSSCQVEPMDSVNVNRPIPNTTKRLTTKTTNISTTQSSAVVDTKTELIENKTHLKLSNNMKKIVSSWDKERLSKAIELFNIKNGKYFSLLEKIYQDDGNYLKPSNSINNIKTDYSISRNKFNNFDQTFLNYEEDEFERIVEKSQREKFR